MTEEEAKTKWCPHAIAQTTDQPQATAVNRQLRGTPDIGCHCIASACMAWRWDNEWSSATEEGMGGDQGS